MNEVQAATPGSHLPNLSRAYPGWSTYRYFARTSVFATGSKYTIKVTIAKPFKSSTPASQTLSWQGAMVTLGNFVLN